MKAGDRIKVCKIVNNPKSQGLFKPQDKYCRNNCKFVCAFNSRHKEANNNETAARK